MKWRLLHSSSFVRAARRLVKKRHHAAKDLLIALKLLSSMYSILNYGRTS
jgi:hypothetical protein